jgi:hypothetical protein
MKSRVSCSQLLELRTGGCRLHKSICICCVTFVFSELFPYLVCVLFHLFLDFDLYIVVTSTNKSIIIIIIFWNWLSPVNIVILSLDLPGFFPQLYSPRPFSIHHSSAEHFLTAGMVSNLKAPSVYFSWWRVETFWTLVRLEWL